jgi:hypothetical protein
MRKQANRQESGAKSTLPSSYSAKNLNHVKAQSVRSVTNGGFISSGRQSDANETHPHKSPVKASEYSQLMSAPSYNYR